MVDSAYRVFTHEFDEIVTIDALAGNHFGQPIEGADDWRGIGDYFLSHQPHRPWGRDAGISALDQMAEEASALTDLTKAAAALGDAGTTLTILADNSGSMRGLPIVALSEALYQAAPHLAAAGVRLEVLGYSTVEWKGGRARKKWLDEGKPVHPGRLNATRHIVYIDGDAPWTAGRESMLLAMRMEGLLKENFENEALRWAADRMSEREGYKALILVVDSDRPIDDATLAVNDPDFLRLDLKDAIGMVESHGIDFETVFLDMRTDTRDTIGPAPLYPRHRTQVVKSASPTPADLLRAFATSLRAMGSRLTMEPSPRP